MYGNVSTSGSANALAFNGSMIRLVNSTITGNNPTGAQAVITWGGVMTITNSIMWNNALPLQSDPPCSTCFVVSFSLIEGGFSGTGNKNEDPRFMDAAINDYHLQAISPAVDAGTIDGATAIDLDGNLRDAYPDMGAYEWVGRRVYLPMAIKN